MSEDNVQNYMGHQWLLIEGDTVTIGISEEGVDEIDSINEISLPEEGEEVVGDEVCASIDTDDGPLDIYCPADGKVLEVNSAVVEDPSIIIDDPLGEGWILKVEINDPAELKIALENDAE